MASVARKRWRQTKDRQCGEIELWTASRASGDRGGLRDNARLAAASGQKVTKARYEGEGVSMYARVFPTWGVLCFC